MNGTYLQVYVLRSIESYTVTSSEGTTYTVEAGELLYIMEEEASPSTIYEVTVMANLEDGSTETIGMVEFKKRNGWMYLTIYHSCVT